MPVLSFSPNTENRWAILYMNQKQNWDCTTIKRKATYNSCTVLPNLNFICYHSATGWAGYDGYENWNWSQKRGAHWRCIYIKNKFLYNQSLIPHKLVHRMCLWMAPQVKEQRSNKNHNELVMAVIKYGRDFYLQPVIKLPLQQFMEMLAPHNQTLFAKGMLITCREHFEYIGRWTFCLIEHSKLESRH